MKTSIPSRIGDYVGQYHAVKGEVMKRYDKVQELIAQDEVACKLLDGLLNAACRYFGKVIEMESRLKNARLRLDGESLRALTEDLDHARRFAHDALISDLHIFNRYLVKEYGEDLEDEGIQGGIFPNPDAIRDRLAIADWAGDLLYGIYTDRSR